MIERYLKHRKWIRELNTFFEHPEVSKFLVDEFLKLELTKIYILEDIKNRASFRILKAYLEKNADFTVNINKTAERFAWNGIEKEAGIVIADEQYKEKAFRYGISFLTLFDIYNFFVCRQYYSTELPRVLNSIENGYRTIGVVTSGKYSGNILKYLQNNQNIQVVEIDKVQLKQVENKRTYLYKGADAVDIVIIPDFRVSAQVIDREGKPIPAFFLVNLTSTGNSFIGDSFYDIEKKIVPYLVDQGVKVLWCSQPKETVLSPKVKRKIKRDAFIRNISPVLYSHIRKREQERENLGFMHGLGKNTRIDCSKGYRECFGNVEYLNYDNGFRRTIGNDSESKRNIWVFGPCLVDPNARVDDARTITSILKGKIGKGYNVHNRGGSFGGMGLLIRNTRFGKGDIAIIFSVRKEENDAATSNFDLTESYQKINSLERHINDSVLHCDSSVIRQIAEDLFGKLAKEKMLCHEEEADVYAPICLGSSRRRIPAVEMIEEGDFKQYLLRLKDYGKDKTIGKTGAIVMNCNPFTLGHRYLIETAAGQVDRLYVFVVEEDKSFFPFEDRYKLVKEGTLDLENVSVIPSGNYIISSQTLAGYFEKDSIGDIHLDATADLELFVQIASMLNITVRFAGEEPIDAFTRQYNENMKMTLNAYGVQFVEIKRKEEQGEPISASKVRELLKQKRYKDIQKIVPPITYEYLMGRPFA